MTKEKTPCPICSIFRVLILIVNSSIYSIKSKFQAHEYAQHNGHRDFKVKEIDDEQRKAQNGHLFCFIGFVEIENSMPCH